MNPITNIKNQNKLNDRELALGVAGDRNRSWHREYKDSAWIYIGGLSYELSEGDIITVFSQWGEVININLLREKGTGKSRGFAFLCYQDQRSTDLAVDNMNGTTLLKRLLRVDHVHEYKLPKYREDADEKTKQLWEKGCAPEPIHIAAPTQDELAVLREAKKQELERVVPIVAIDKDILKAKKRLKKEKKKEKKRLKKEKKRIKKEKKLAESDPNGDWKAKQKLMDKIVEDKDLYGVNEHFNFGKKIEEKAESEFNPRPDFEKADYRDIEMWKIVREQEKAEKIKRGESVLPFEEGKAYLPTRFKRGE